MTVTDAYLDSDSESTTRSDSCASTSSLPFGLRVLDTYMYSLNSSGLRMPKIAKMEVVVRPVLTKPAVDAQLLGVVFHNSELTIIVKIDLSVFYTRKTQ